MYVYVFFILMCLDKYILLNYLELGWWSFLLLFFVCLFNLFCFVFKKC